jgi:hypothetical protein
MPQRDEALLKLNNCGQFIDLQAAQEVLATVVFLDELTAGAAIPTCLDDTEASGAPFNVAIGGEYWTAVGTTRQCGAGVRVRRLE